MNDKSQPPLPRYGAPAFKKKSNPIPSIDLQFVRSVSQRSRKPHQENFILTPEPRTELRRGKNQLKKLVLLRPVKNLGTENPSLGKDAGTPKGLGGERPAAGRAKQSG
jgi:hypothetical protein